MNKPLNHKLTHLLKEKGKVYLPDLHELLPEIKGELAIMMPTIDGANKNIVWIYKVNQVFADVFNDLLYTSKMIDWEPADPAELLLSNKPFYSGVKLLSEELAKTQEECWLPIYIKLSERGEFVNSELMQVALKCKEDDKIDRIIEEARLDYSKEMTVFGDWVLEDDGSITNVVRDYCIEADRLTEPDWIYHMAGKGWCNLNDFIFAYFSALNKQGHKNLTIRTWF